MFPKINKPEVIGAISPKGYRNADTLHLYFGYKYLDPIQYYTYNYLYRMIIDSVIIIRGGLLCVPLINGRSYILDSLRSTLVSTLEYSREF